MSNPLKRYKIVKRKIKVMQILFMIAKPVKQLKIMPISGNLITSGS
jgi:hypothetical protein